MIVPALEQRLNQQKNRIGLVGGRLKLLERADVTEPLAAAIVPGDWHLDITVKAGYEPVRDTLTARYVSRRNLAAPLDKICEDLVYHECGHWELPRSSNKGCPYDVPTHDLILEAVSQVLARHHKAGHAAYVANAFEDVLDNTNCKQHTTHAGQILFWNEQGLTHGKFGKFYDAFVRLNLALWGDAIDGQFLKRHYGRGKEASGAAQALLSQWHMPKGKGADALKQRIDALYDKSRWPQLAAQFAEVMAPLLEPQMPHRMFGAGNQGPGQSDGQSGGSPAGGADAGGTPQSAFDRKLAGPEGQEEAAEARYLAGRGPATNRDSFEQLDALYRRLARDIPVEIATFTESYSFPLVPYGKEPYDPDTHDLLARQVRLGLQDDGSVGLVVNRGWIETPESYKRTVRQFSKFRLAKLDTSLSMSWNMRNEHDAAGKAVNVGSQAFIPWGDQSKYHYALLGYYGIERFLMAQHIAPYVERGVVNFSGTTESQRGEEGRRLLLTPQWGGTVLDVEVLRQAVPDADTFLLSLSDGDIANWSTIRDAYRAIVTGCIAAHIQLGGPNAFSCDLESWGVPVYPVNSGDDLTRLMVKVASDKYKAYGDRR